MECRESNLGLLGEKQDCYLCAMQPPPKLNNEFLTLQVIPEFVAMSALLEFGARLERKDEKECPEPTERRVFLVSKVCMDSA